MRDDRLLLKDILIALDRIDSFTKGMNFESFIADEKTMNAVTYNFLVIGEAVKLLPDTLTGAYPEIPWRQIAGMRDKPPMPASLSIINLLEDNSSLFYPGSDRS